jgi:DNA-binding winged helix-turn-helix (wHTH) protein/class 3 adenylate cyclase/predicted ATPase
MDQRDPGGGLFFEGFRLERFGLSRLVESGANEPVALGSRALELLLLLVERQGRLVTKDQIMETVWPGVAVEEGNLTVQISALRRVLDRDRAQGSCIQTIIGRGYRFVAPVTSREAAARSSEPVPSKAESGAGSPPHPSNVALSLLDLGGDREQPVMRSPFGPNGRAFGPDGPDAHPPPISVAERRQLTVMVCDVIGLQDLASRLDPEELAEIVGRFRRTVAALAEPLGGSLCNYSTDGILVYFGFPQAHEDDPERAVRAGLGIVEAISRLEPGSIKLRARIGIATGLVVVGDPIGEGRGPPAVLGETPYLAVRFKDLADPETVVISASTRRLVGNLFEYIELGRGAAAADTVPAWRVLGPRVVSRFAALRGPALQPLVGRDDEIDLLLRRWARAKAGEGQVMLISGEPGIGKSRIAAELLQRLRTEPHLRLRYYCSSYHQDSALFPVIEQIGRAAGFARGDPPETKLEKLESLLARAGPPDGDVALIADLLSLPESGRNPLPKLSAQRKKQRTLEALLRQLEGLAARAPVLVMFEDVHWIDPTSRELLDQCVACAPRLPVLLIVTFRHEFQPPWTGHERVGVLALNRLDRRDRTALAAQIAGGKALPREVLARIVDRTDGIPLFIEELTKSVLESGLLREEPDRYVLDRALPTLAIPTTLHASLLARLDRLPSVRHVAQIGAAIGREFSYPLIRAVSSLPDDELGAALARVVASGLVSQRGIVPEAIYGFKHALVQDAAHGSLLRSTRRQLHAQIAHLIEEQFPSLAEVQPQILAQHFTEADSLEKAAAYWCRAGRQSAAKSAIIEAIGQLRRGLQLVARMTDDRERKLLELDLQVTLGGALRWAKSDADPEVIGTFGRARDLLLDTGGSGTITHFSVQYALWSAEYIGGRPLGALHHAHEFLSLAQSQKATELCSMGNRLVGASHMMSGDYSRALSHLQCAATSYAPEEDQRADFRFGVDLHVAVLVGWAWALWHGGFPDQADRAASQGLRRAHQSDHPLTLVYALTSVGLIAASERRTTEVEELAREAIAVSNEQGFGFFLPWALMLQGWTMAQRSRGKDAVDRIRDGLDMLRATGSRPQEPIGLGLLAEALVLANATEEGLAVLAEALATAQSSGAKGNDAELHRLRGDLLGQLPFTLENEAEACFRTALEVARKQGTRGFELRAAMRLARHWRDQGRRAEALDLLTPVYGWFREGFSTPDLTEARALLDELT